VIEFRSFSLSDWVQNIQGGSGLGSVVSVTFTGDGTVLSSTPSSAVTTTGTVTGTLNTQAANKVLAGPTSGGNAAPTFRTLVAADLPTITVPIGGTGLASLTAYAVLCGGTTSTAVMQQVSGLGTSGQVLTSNGAGVLPTWQAGGGGGGSGTVTSVGLALPSIITVSGSPVTTSGTLTGALATQTANLLFAGPTTGSAAAPTFRALVSADLPAITASHQINLLLGGGVDLAVATNVSSFYPVMPAAGTFTRWDLVAKTPSVGASIILDVFKSSNQGSTWVNLWSSTGNYPTLTAAAVQSSGTTFDTAGFAAGDIIRVDVVQTGTSTKGQGVTLALVAQY
jgi:hypothetical protein